MPIITRTSNILPLSVVTAVKGYDSEENHVLVRERLKAYSIIPPRNMHAPICRTHGRYRKQMKRGYSKLLYNQRNKDETIMSVIKRLFGEYVTSRLVKTQNRELSFRCIPYNMYRLTNLIILVMLSTEPAGDYAYHIKFGPSQYPLFSVDDVVKTILARTTLIRLFIYLEILALNPLMLHNPFYFLLNKLSMTQANTY